MDLVQVLHEAIQRFQFAGQMYLGADEDDDSSDSILGEVFPELSETLSKDDGRMFNYLDLLVIRGNLLPEHILMLGMLMGKIMLEDAVA